MSKKVSKALLKRMMQELIDWAGDPDEACSNEGFTIHGEPHMHEPYYEEEGIEIFVQQDGVERERPELTGQDINWQCSGVFTEEGKWVSRTQWEWSGW